MRPRSQIFATDAAAVFRELGLEQHLTPQRSNGVRAMIERIRSDAAAAAADRLGAQDLSSGRGGS